MRTPQLTAWPLAAALAAGCGAAGAPAQPPAHGLQAVIRPGAAAIADVPSQGFLLQLELRAGIRTQAIHPDADHVDVAITGQPLATPFARTIQRNEFVNDTAQLVIGSLAAGSYRVSASLKAAGGATLAEGGLDVVVVSGQSASASLVLIYGSASSGGLDARLDAQGAQLAITSMAVSPLVLYGSGYPARITIKTNRDDWGGLTYQYTATGGDISGTGPEVFWIAPQVQAGTYIITAQVADGTSPPVSQPATITVEGGVGNVFSFITFNNF